MVKGIAILTFVCLCLMFGTWAISHANSGLGQTYTQEHIEEVKRTNPEKYEAMVQRTEENMTDCSSCHEKIDKKEVVKEENR